MKYLNHLMFLEKETSSDLRFTLGPAINLEVLHSDHVSNALTEVAYRWLQLAAAGIPGLPYWGPKFSYIPRLLVTKNPKKLYLIKMTNNLRDYGNHPSIIHNEASPISL